MDPMNELVCVTQEIYEEGGEEWKENKECTWTQSDMI